MAQITKRDQLVINELLDHGVFTTTPLAAATQLSRGAIADLKKPSVQKRIGFYFKNMFFWQRLKRSLMSRNYRIIKRTGPLPPKK